jgi:hypothetical protein
MDTGKNRPMSAKEPEQKFDAPSKQFLELVSVLKKQAKT